MCVSGGGFFRDAVDRPIDWTQNALERARPGRWSSPGSTPIRNAADALKTWGRAYWNAVHPFNLEAAYVNFMMDNEADGRLRATYGGNDG